MRRIGLVALLVVGCTSEGSSPERTSVANPSADASAEAASPLGDAGGSANGGRDSTPPSCFAACQSARFGCQAKADGGTIVTEAELAPNDLGCTGTLAKPGEAPVAFELHCLKGEVCSGGAAGTSPTACVPATFSALAFDYTPAGQPPNVCTRRD